MGKKKGKKGKTEDSGAQPSGSQQPETSAQQPTQPPREGAKGTRPEKETAEGKPVAQQGKARQSQKEQPPETSIAQQRPQPVDVQREYGDRPSEYGDGGQSQEHQKGRKRRPRQGQTAGQEQGKPTQQAQPVESTQGPQRQPGHPVPPSHQWPRPPPQQPETPRGPPSGPYGAQPTWGPRGQPGQPFQPVGQQPWRQQGGPPQQQQQPPQQQQQPPPQQQQPPPHMIPQQKGPWVQQEQRGPPPGISRQAVQPPPDMAQQPRVVRHREVSESSSASVSSDKQPKIQKSDQPQQSPQKGKQKGPKQAGPRETATTSHEPPTRGVSQIQISGTEGRGDTQLIPMEYIKAQPGVKGRKIQIETNHLSLNLGKLKTAVHYDVNLVPDTPKKFLRDVLELFRKKHYNNRYPAFDGRKNLYSSSPLPFGDFIADEIVIQEREGYAKKYKVEIKFANNVDLTPLQDLLRSKATPREAMQVVDIVLRSAPAVTCISVGRSFFVKPPAIIDLGEGMEMYSGFYQSAIRGWKPFLNVDVAHKAFPKNMNVLDVLLEILGDYFQPFTRESLNRPLGRQDEEILLKYIRTLRVSYEIPGYPSTRRAYRANGIDEPPRTKVFKLDSGESITIEKYFEKHKNYRLRYPHLPSIWVGALSAEKKILLPLELCTVIEGQAVNRKMTENQTSKMIKHAATDTTRRKQKIMASLQEARHNNHPSVREFGFSVGNEFEKLQARVLQPPTLMYSANKTVQPARGIWRGDKFFKGMVINKWTIVCVDRRPARNEDLGSLANMIMKNAEASGMVITAQAEKPFPHIRSQTLMDIKKYFHTQKEKEYDVIFVIIPNSGPQYSYVKTAAEINVGCLTQCIKSRTLNKLNPQTVINILLKVNSKLNGTNHFLGSRPLIMNRPCMIMGADVTHPGPDARDIPSVAAVTASHDPKAFQYNICWRLQPPKMEIIEDLEAIVIEQLKYFEQKNRVKPERLIFFRDGVSEGQFEQVRTAEIRAIRAACKKVQASDYEPAVTFLVVQKRHHTRLFPTNPRDSEDRNLNVPAGTCVDTIITHPFMQDFYLVSHASIQGVAKPTKYCTLWDDNSMTNDDIEELTYFLCHMFTRCNRSVSYPAPTYYAHLAAARAKVYIENERLNMDNLPREYIRFQILDVVRKDKPMFFV